MIVLLTTRLLVFFDVPDVSQYIQSTEKVETIYDEASCLALKTDVIQSPKQGTSMDSQMIWDIFNGHLAFEISNIN